MTLGVQLRDLKQILLLMDNIGELWEEKYMIETVDGIGSSTFESLFIFPVGGVGTVEETAKFRAQNTIFMVKVLPSELWISQPFKLWTK